MFGGLHGDALVRLARWLSNVGVAAMRPDVGADVLQAAKADGAKTIEIAVVPGAIFRGAVARAAARFLRLMARTAITEIGLMRHQEGDKPDPEDRANDHADTPILLMLSNSLRARLFPGP